MTYGPEIKWKIPHLNRFNSRATNFRIFLFLLAVIGIIFITFSYYPSFKTDTSVTVGETFTAVNNAKNREDTGNTLGSIAKGFNEAERNLRKDRVQLNVKNVVVTKVGGNTNVHKEEFIHYKRGKELVIESVDKDGDIDIDTSVGRQIEIVEDEDEGDEEIGGGKEAVEEDDDEIDEVDDVDSEDVDAAEDIDNDTVTPDGGDEGDTVTPDDVDGDTITPDGVKHGVTTSSVMLPSNSPDQFHWNDSRLDILHMPKLPLDPSFQNPCWYESLDSPDPYKDNVYATFSNSANRVLDRLNDHWEEVFDEEAEPKRLRCLPYFLIIGQPKCGSTDLFWKIAKHPDVDTPPIKELHWWSRSRQGRRLSYSKIIPFSDYVDMFDQAAVRIEQRVSNVSYNHDSHDASHIITGEASVSLFWDNSDWFQFPENWGLQEPRYIIPHYVSHVLPKVKLIIVLREPADRLYSDYLYFSGVNKKSADHFHSLVQDAISVYTSCIRLHQLRECVYNRSVAYKVKVRLRIGMYSVYMDDWLKEFAREQFYVFRLEDYSKNSLETIREIYQFLDIRKLTSREEKAVLASAVSNSRSQKDKRLGGMHEKTRRLLHNFYRPYNTKLAKTLGHRKYLWEDFM